MFRVFKTRSLVLKVNFQSCSLCRHQIGGSEVVCNFRGPHLNCVPYRFRYSPIASGLAQMVICLNNNNHGSGLHS
jgi:hypothetical protein